MRGGAGAGNGERGAGTEEHLRLPGYAKLHNMYTSYITQKIYIVILFSIYIYIIQLYISTVYFPVDILVFAGPSPGSPLADAAAPVGRKGRHKMQ